MTKPFDMELFLTGVLTGSHATRQRHLRQAESIQAAIAERWQIETPWGWKRKHLAWFLKHRVKHRGEGTRYYYLLTVRLITRRLETSWIFDLKVKTGPPPQPTAHFHRELLTTFRRH